MNNPYLQYGDSFFTRSGRRPKSHIATSEKEAPKVLHGAEKAVAEASAQMRNYERGRREETKKALEGPHGESVRALMDILKGLTPQSAPLLLAALDYIGWFRNADDDTRFLVLGLIDDAICRMRVRDGRSPIDDSLPGEPPTVFEICRSNLQPRGE